MDEVSVKIGESKEGLDVLDSFWFGPILDNLTFDGVHGKSVW